MISRIRNWLNQRWPFSYLIHLALHEEIPGGSRFAYTFGSALLTVFAIQVVTGILQLFYYAPTVDHAYDSVNFMRTKIPFGWLVNGLHYWGANAMIVIIVLHITRVFVWGAYKRPRELTWLLGVSLLLLVMGSSFTGGPLSWDQKAYWEAEVGTSIPGSIPVVGNTIQRIMRGGDEMGQLTLSRLFIVHAAILPTALFFLIIAHLIALRMSGSVGPWDEIKRASGGPFWPDQVFKDGLTATIVILTLITLAVFAAKAFNGAADPLDAQFVPKPEWNFLFLYQALKFFPGRLEPIGAAVFPLMLILPLILLPFLDRSPEKNPLKRPIVMSCGLFFWGIILALTAAGYYSKPAAGEAPTPPSLVPRTATSVSEPVHAGAQLFQSQGCVACHRINGTGGTIGPDLSGEGQKGRTKDWLATQVRHPKAHNPASIMPSFSSLTDRQVNDLVEYLLGLKKGAVSPAVPAREPVSPEHEQPPDKTVRKTSSQEALSPKEKTPGLAADIIGSAERGAALFQMECALCHGPNGTGRIVNPGSDEGVVPPLNPIDTELSSKDPEEFARNIDIFIQHGSTPPGPAPTLKMPAFGDSNTLTQQQISNAEAYLLSINKVDRAEIKNPGIPPRRFFFIVLPAVIIVLLILGGIYKCLP